MNNNAIKGTLIFLICLALLIPLGADAAGESPIMVYKNTSNHDFSEQTARLTIVSASGNGESRYGMPSYGHTFLVIENTSPKTIDFCGRMIAPRENITFGWWAVSVHSGIWFSLESNFIDNFDRYPSRVALSREIDGEGLSRLCDYLLTHDIYTPIENCALRAVAAFNTAIPETRLLNVGYFTTPARVAEEITANGGSHEAAVAMNYTDREPNFGFGEEIEYFKLVK